MNCICDRIGRQGKPSELQVSVVNSKVTSQDEFLGVLIVLNDFVDIACGDCLFNYFLKFEFVLMLYLRDQCKLCPKIEVA